MPRLKEESSALNEEVLTSASGMQQIERRFASMVPGIRELYRMSRDVKELTVGNIAGAIGILLIAYQIISQILAAQKAAEEKMRTDVFSARGFTTTAEFVNWQNTQRQAMDNYRNGVIP